MVAVGNSYEGTGTLDLKDFNIDAFAERGANYPYNATNGGNLSGPLQDFGPIVAPNSTANLSRIINSTKINNTILGSFIINSTNDRSRIENSSESFSLINRSSVFSSN